MKASLLPAIGLAALLTLFCAALPFVPAAAISAEASAAANSQPWWQHAVFYEIYPRSFADGNDKGMGNLKGITAKLDYLHDLGVDAIWITPCYPSPQVDFGYDISDYCNIAPEYGTLADFDELVSQAAKRHIRIIMDLVMNHTSDKHPWFVQSRSSKDDPKRDWYVWRDGKNGGPPNNWNALFGHSAWEFDPKTGQYYYHFFYKEQPDLNWRNPQVKNAMFDVARFWLNRGASGFRLDAINTLYEDPQLRDNAILPGKNKFGDPNMNDEHNHMACMDELHQTLRDLRQATDQFPGAVLIGETVGKQVSDLAKMYGEHLDELQMPMNFFFSYVDKLSPDEFRKQISAWDGNAEHGWPVYLFGNHDRTRHYDRYGDGKHNDQIAKLTATMLLTLRGTPILYYGEEIGMSNTDPKTKEQVKDPIGKIGWPKEKGRDGERTPMQWSPALNAGFSTVAPWLPVGANYKTHNVASEQSDPNSILNFYKALIRIRRSSEPLLEGAYMPLNEKDQSVLSYLRKGTNGAVLVALNMTNQPHEVSFDLSDQGIQSKQVDTLLSAPSGFQSRENLKHLALPPFGVYIGSVAKD
jgi:alpha-glucosidase